MDVRFNNRRTVDMINSATRIVTNIRDELISKANGIAAYAPETLDIGLAEAFEYVENACNESLEFLSEILESQKHLHIVSRDDSSLYPVTKEDVEKFPDFIRALFED